MNFSTASLTSLAFVLASSVLAGPASSPGSLHVRGTVESLQGGLLTVRTATGIVRIQLAKAPVVSVIPTDRSRIKEGSFLGIASVPGTSGSQIAREVVVFPEAARGSGEGSYPWDLPGAGGAKTASKMTNGTVGMSRMTDGTAGSSRMTNGTASHSKMTNGTVHGGAAGTVLTLRYKSGAGTGTQTIRLTPGIPVVTFEPGTTSQLKPGAHVVVFAHLEGGKTLADRTLVGKNGLVPPM